MPRPPQLSLPVRSTRGAVYSPWVDVVQQHPGETYPFHVGDTWREPIRVAWMQNLCCEEIDGLHRYTPTDGIPELLSVLRSRAFPSLSGGLLSRSRI